MRAVFIWLAGLLGTSLAVVISYFWLDRPIALRVHEHLQFGYHGALMRVSHVPDPLIPLAIIALIVLGLRAAVSQSLPADYQAAAFVASVSVLATETIKNQLKFVFSRSWPESWTGNNPSFIRNGVYGFHFLHGGASYQSFPSGHMAASCAVIAVLWIWYPRWRLLYFSATLAVGLGLVAANYHFVSDVIAGAFIGTSIGWIATVIWTALLAASARRSE
jgi:membrane-associated phospholipid phosphatase